MESILLNADDSAALLGISRRQWYKLASMGKTPEAVLLGKRLQRWRRQEILDWVEAGTPKRADWERTKKGKKKGRQ